MSGTRRKAGLLGPQVEGYRAWLAQRGYTPGTVRNMLKDLGQVGLWLSAEGLEVAQLDEARVAAFLAARRAAGHRQGPGARGMVPLLSYLREVGSAPAARPSSTPLDALLGSTGPGWSRSGAWPRRRCSATRTPPAASFGAGVAGWGVRAGGSDRGGRERVPAPGVRSGVGGVGQGTGRRAAVDPEIPLSAGHHAVAAGHGRASGRWLAARHAAAHDGGRATSSCCWTAATAAPRSASGTSRS